jgi:hypothetical protein
MARALPFIVPVALALYALIDLSRSTAVERAGLHPAAWAAIILLLPVVGPIAWIVVSISQRNSQGAPARPSSGPRGGSAGSSSGRTRPGRRQGPVAPDDDPDFLWRLDMQQRRRRRTDAPTESPSDGPSVTPAGSDDQGEPTDPSTGKPHPAP